MGTKTLKLPFGVQLTYGRATEEEIRAAVLEELRRTPSTDNDRPGIQAGRSSVPEGLTTISSILTQLGAIEPTFDVRFLEVLENLAMYNHDVSFAVDNVVQLGNTDFTIEFDDSVPDELAEEMRKHINGKKANWYAHSGGLNSLINDLFAQIAITGALSAEIVPREDLTTVSKSVLVNPKNIKFLYDPEKDVYMAHQMAATSAFGDLAARGLKELNPVTYKYYAIRRFNERPYAIPPFLAALEQVTIERDMIDNMKSYIKKLGLFGFLQVLLNAPAKKSAHAGGAAETDAQYQARLQEYLKASADELDKSLSTGKVIGYKGAHEFELSGVTQNGTQVKEVFELMQTMKMAGLKQDPLMLGRNFSTTETVGRVILAKLSNQITNYQALVEAFLCEMFSIELELAGFTFNEVMVNFDKPMLSDELKDQQALQAKIQNYNDLYNQGVISQSDRAQALGYEEADQDEPRNQFENPGIDPNADPDGNRTAPGNDGSSSNTLAYSIREIEGISDIGLRIELMGYSLNSQVPEFDYQLEGCSHDCAHDHDMEFNLSEEDAEQMARGYSKEMRALYGKAVQKISKAVSDELNNLGAAATLERAIDVTIYHMYKQFRSQFSDKQLGIISRWVRRSYKSFRSSTSAFGDFGDNIPKSTFGLIDQRTLEYFKNSDGIYLGKFITDKDTRRKVTEFIKKKHIAGELPLGKSNQTLRLFRQEFGDLLQGEEHKIFRIINTTVNTMKTYASINYLEQAGVTTYEIRGINDRLQCPFCAEMQGKQFQVSAAYDIVDQVVSSDPAYVKAAKPFINSVYKKPEDLAAASHEELMSKGVTLPAFHPGCRDRVIAVL